MRVLTFCVVLAVAVAVAPRNAQAAHEAVRAAIVSPEDKRTVAMLEVMGRVSGMVSVSASQYFELIEDPLMNLAQPVVAEIIVQMTKEAFIQLLCFLLVPFIMDLIALPVGDAIWPGVDPASIAGSAGLEGYEGADKFGASSSSSTTTTTTTTTTEEVVEEAAFVEVGAGGTFFLAFGGCDSAVSEEQCKAQRGGFDTACAWCVHTHARGEVSKCIPCSGDGNVTVNGEAAFPCQGFDAQCALPPDKLPPDKPPPEEPEEPMEPPNETAAAIQDAANDAVIEQLANSLPTPTADFLRDRLPGSIARGVHRAVVRMLVAEVLVRVTETVAPVLKHALAVTSTKVLTATLTSSLTSAIAPTIAVSMAHDPAADTYCDLCDTHGRYCRPCEVSRDKDQWLAAVATHTGKHFGDYYGWHFAAMVQ